MSNTGLRYNAGKPRMSLLPFDALREVAKVLTFGAQKYAPHNWRKGLTWSETYDSLIRHLTARLSGELRDPETGELHTAQIACNALFLVSFELSGAGKDDLWPGYEVEPPPPPEPPLPEPVPGTLGWAVQMLNKGHKVSHASNEKEHFYKLASGSVESYFGDHLHNAETLETFVNNRKDYDTCSWELRDG